MNRPRQLLEIGDVLREVAAGLRMKQQLREKYTAETLAVFCPTCEAWPDFLCNERGEPCLPHPARVTAGPREAASRLAAEESAKRQQIRQTLERADVPARHIEVLAGERLNNSEPLKAVRKWRASFGRPLIVLVGARGIGKSLAAAWAASQGPRRGAGSLWVQATDLAAMPFFGASGARLEAVRRVGLLVIDEVGVGEVGKVEEWKPRFEGVLCARHDRELDTIVTSNMSVEEFAAAHDERLLDRLRPGTGGLVYSCDTVVSARSGRGAP